MSYVKFGWEKSDVYLYGGADGPEGPRFIVCSGCLFYRSDPEDPFSSPGVEFYSEYSMLAHLDEHRKAGHTVPQSAADKIKEDDWI